MVGASEPWVRRPLPATGLWPSVRTTRRPWSTTPAQPVSGLQARTGRDPPSPTPGFQALSAAAPTAFLTTPFGVARALATGDQSTTAETGTPRETCNHAKYQSRGSGVLFIPDGQMSFSQHLGSRDVFRSCVLPPSPACIP